ncbi:sensor histidine kinase [Nocardioides sp. AX2bis]|uniref:sensor histidine kinase n=1 Tax=Nocardioides sp. AX2bis TaxID=2653157 RepID=UPI0013584A9F|nr:PAS domain-containing sensor histidine kinase [Nocardioides sp. AX2bis]
MTGSDPTSDDPVSQDVVAALRDAGDHPLMDSFPQGAIFAFDRDLRYLSAGGHGLEDVGLSRSMLEGRTISEVFPAETVGLIEPLYRAALDGTSTTWDVPFEGRTYTQRLAPVTDAAGAVVAGLGFTQDVTEARAAEQALRESALQNRLTFEHAPIGKAIVELDGTWRQVNAALCELTGYTEQQLLGMTFQDITHPDDLDLDLDHLGRLVEGEIRSYQIEKRYVTASHQVVWVLLSVALVRSEEGAPLYFISQIVDITETKRQYQALQDLTAMVAHDLRTPAAVVRGFAELLEGRAAADPQKVRDYAARIAASAEAMMVLTDNALTATAISDGHVAVRPAAVTLRGAVDAAVRAADLGATSVDTEALDDLAAWVDPVHLGQVLTNLLTNAAKYGDGRIVVSSTSAEGRVRISVTDDGRGVEPDFVPYLFERYSRSAAARAGRQRGSGLGLHIVSDLVTANDGHVTYARSALGGADFVVELPAAPHGPLTDR